jgi:serine/threonine-protein kinase
MDQIGQYVVLRLLGEGGMGKVFEAEEKLSKRRVALKVLKPELAGSEDGRRLFLNEMTILSQIDHKNVVRCLACSEVDGQLVMTLEYLEGQTLRQYLTERGSLGWTQAVAIAAQVAEALVVAHEREPPIVHRDLKPENIMVLEDTTVKVMDFGIAKVLEVMHKTTTQSVGTLQYMSPEQIDATGVDARSDLYCLGLILYEMLSGHAPFDSASPRQLLNQQCTEPPPPLVDEVRSSLPRGVERLLMALLEKAPEERPQSAALVLQELEPFAPATRLAANAEHDQAARSARESSRGSSTSSRTTSGSLAPGPGVSASTPHTSRRTGQQRARVQDTIELLERGSRSIEVDSRVAWAAIIGLSLAAGAITHWVKSGTGEPLADPTTASVQAGAQD